MRTYQKVLWVVGMEGMKIKIKPAKEGVASHVALSAQGEAEGGIPRLVNDFQEMVKKYLVEQVRTPNAEKVEVKVTKIF